MKGFTFAAAILGAAAIGAAVGVLLAPDKGENTRSKIKEYLRQKGIKLPCNKVDALLDELEEEVATK